MSDDLPDIELTIEQAAMLFQSALSVIVRMEEEEFDQRPSSAAIPRAVMCCADALLLVPAAMLLTARMYPQLMDVEVLQQALRNASSAMPTIN